MKKILLLFLLLIGLFGLVDAQVNYTANDQITPYTGKYRFGANMGYYPPWTDEDLATIAAGDPSQQIQGAGVKTLRPALFEYFLDYFGYDFRVPTFQHYDNLGIKENTVFVGYPNEAHRDPTEFCPGVPSELFANMYDDIWDNGENGTPVNDNNLYALYIYKTVSHYKDYVKFWEIWNEPDFDFAAKAWLPRDQPGNWWQNDPDPCDYALHAPVQHYVRLLRISYEVIKSVDPSAYVAVGGLGYPSFLHAVLRNTDNPNDGAVSWEYPYGGGAYFDVLSYHSYPHIDGSLREWSNDIMNFNHFRHTDRAIDGMLLKKDEFNEVLEEFGYNGNTYPEKEWIITESNLPGRKFGEYIGSDEAERNYLMKASVVCQQNDIRQFYMYMLSNGWDVNEAWNEFQTMGLFKKLEGTQQFNQEKTVAGYGHKTISDALLNKTHDADKTAALQLPEGIRGGAFYDENTERYTYVLWAKTSIDESESASATYSIPSDFGIEKLQRITWDHSITQLTTQIGPESIQLEGTPIIFVESEMVTAPVGVEEIEQVGQLSAVPNPFNDRTAISFDLNENTRVNMEIYNMQGQLLKVILKDRELQSGPQRFEIDSNDLSAGLYLCKVHAGQQTKSIKLVRF